MPSLATDHLRRLQTLLATARADYDTRAYLILEGATQLTLYSLQRCITVPLADEEVGELNGLLAEAALARIARLEQEVVEAHAQVVSEADDRQLDVDQLAAFRQQPPAAS